MTRYETYCAILPENWQEQPELDVFIQAYRDWPRPNYKKRLLAGPGYHQKAFLQAVTLDHAKRLLAEGLPLLETSFELGLSSPGRLHDLFVTHEAMSPGVYKAQGEGLEIHYGFHSSPFGEALIMATEPGFIRVGVCG